MGASPAVSVLLPVFNAESVLTDCLESLEKQTLDRFEIVVVDDGSTDRTPEILDVWRRRDPRIRVVRQEHAGIVTALNRGIGECRGEFIARMDADDICQPERLQLQQRALSEHRALGVVGCLVECFSSQGLGEGFRLYERWLNSLVDDSAIRREMFIESPLAHPSVMIRRSILEDVDGYRDVGWPEDYDLWLRLAAHGCTFSKVPRTLLRWRDHEQRLTRTDGRYATARFIDCKAWHLLQGPLRDARRVVIWGAGQTGRKLASRLLQHGAALEAFIDIDPRKCGTVVRGRPVLAADDLDASFPAGFDRPVVLTAVASRGARQLIRSRLVRSGWVEGRDFWCAA